MASSWRNIALAGALSLHIGSDGPLVSAQASSRKGVSVSFQGTNSACPQQCSVTGPDPVNWPAYRSLNDLAQCSEAMLYSFSLHDEVDEADSNHRIFACTAYGNDWNDESAIAAHSKIAAKKRDVTYQMGWDRSSPGDESGYTALITQMREYMTHGNGETNTSSILFGQFGGSTAGLYIGQGLRSIDVAEDALNALVAETHLFKGKRDSLTMQLCSPNYDADHTFGFMSVKNGSFDAIQKSLTAWQKGDCVGRTHVQNYTSTAPFTSPLLSEMKGKNVKNFNSTYGVTNSSQIAAHSNKTTRISARATCRDVQVVDGDSCAKLADRCGISGADFTKYNSGNNFCATLRAGQHACCSEGDLPDYRPKPNSDGSCATVTVQKGQTCDSIASSFTLTTEDIVGFNKKTWAFSGCKNLWAQAVICVSKGSPPMPNSIENAICGPQKPGTKKPTNMDDLPKLNPCPLNACCDVFGQCGTTEEFCVDTGTGAPGTAKEGTNGCISNCGMDMIKGPAPPEFRRIGYYEGFNFGRKCLYQDASQIDGSQYTHLHFGFGDITPDFNIGTGDELATYAFNNFKYTRGPKKIISFGGWEFSNAPSTYNILRRGVKPANRLTLAKNIVKFVNGNGLDGVDIDWEYPSVSKPHS